MLETWKGPFGGVPPFDEVKVGQFATAVEASMQAQREELARITAQSAAPSFENTLAAMEDSGRAFNRVMTLFGIWSTAKSSPEFQAVELELAPKLAAFSDEITQNEPLFRRLEAVYQASQSSAELSPEQKRLAWVLYHHFVRSGAKLAAPEKARLAELNQRLASLYTVFGQNILADEEQPAAALASGEVIANTRSAVEPLLTESPDRALRQRVFEAFVSRGDHPGPRDNKPIIAEILKLRAERAALLGYSTHAHWRLEDSMAKTPANALALMEKVWPAAVARVREEVADMQAVARREGSGGPAERFEPWDYRYYAEKVRKEKYDLDESELRPYLQLEKLREGMHWVAGELFGLAFDEVKGLPVYDADVRVWEVREKATGKHVGLWYFDPYARPGKRSGAWMSAWRNQERFRGEVATIVSNTANFMKGAPGEPVLIGWDDARTLFHEFGHALHGLASNVSYPTLSGTSVAADYVEFPSQLLEHWLSTPELLTRFALHHQTGRPIPKELLAKVERAAKFNQGFATVEYLSSALIDQKLHLLGANGGAPIDPATFERETLRALGMPREIVMRHRTPQFGHVFSGDGYAAGYYSYLWADVLTADAFEAFTEARGPYDREVAARLWKHVLSAGNTVEPQEGYRAFRGRDASPDALMRKRGLGG